MRRITSYAVSKGRPRSWIPWMKTTRRISRIMMSFVTLKGETRRVTKRKGDEGNGGGEEHKGDGDER